MMIVEQVCVRLCSLWYAVVYQLLSLVFMIEHASAQRPLFFPLTEYKVRKLIPPRCSLLRCHLFFFLFSLVFSWVIKCPKIYRPILLCLVHLHFGTFHLIKQGFIIDWLPLNQLDVCVCVCGCVWLVDPLHVGPPAPGLLTHIIKGKGLPPSIRSHKDEGHIIICIICLTLSRRSPSCPYLFFLFCWWFLRLLSVCSV